MVYGVVVSTNKAIEILTNFVSSELISLRTSDRITKVML